MTNVMILLVLLSTLQLDSSKSATIQCQFHSDTWVVVQKTSYCYVQNSVDITSVDTAYVDQITGSDSESNKIDEVIGLYILRKTVHYFPQGLADVLKSLTIFEISDSGLKVVHQADIKPFSKLTELNLNGNQLEMIEEGLFDSNTALELISLSNNKISFIDSKVFDNLDKLRFLSLDSNICIDLKTESGLVDVSKVIQAAQDQCNDSSYSKLVHNLEKVSKSLDSENFKAQLTTLEDEIKNSKFVNYFDAKLQSLRADQLKKSFEEASVATSTDSGPTKVSQELSEYKKSPGIWTTAKTTRGRASNDQETTKLGAQCPSFNETLSGVKNNIKEAVMRCTGQFTGVHERFSSLNGTVLDIHKTAVDVKQSNDDMVTKLQALDESLVSMKTLSNQKFEQLETKIDALQNVLMSVTQSKLNKFEEKIDKKFQEIEDKLIKIMKELKVVD